MADYLDILRGFLSVDGVVGGHSRWWKGLEGFDFQDQNDSSKESNNAAPNSDECVYIHFKPKCI